MTALVQVFHDAENRVPHAVHLRQEALGDDGDSHTSTVDRSSTAGSLVCTEFARTGPWPGMGGFIERAAAAHAGVRVLGSAALAIAQAVLSWWQDSLA